IYYWVEHRDSFGSGAYVINSPPIRPGEAAESLGLSRFIYVCPDCKEKYEEQLKAILDKVFDAWLEERRKECAEIRKLNKKKRLEEEIKKIGAKIEELQEEKKQLQEKEK
ncbi:MAG: hypothetical protein J7L26_04705, partial [Candidatus Aminicenantes bacterium]|nr:hypothetical protein [Candidatus Aminicenantes bacterium]